MGIKIFYIILDREYENNKKHIYSSKNHNKYDKK